MSDAIISRPTDISKKADINHKHIPNDVITEKSVLGELSTFVTQPGRISSSGGICKNGIYFFPGGGVNCYSYILENDFESGKFTSVSVNPSNSGIYLTDNPESENQIYMVSGMLNSGTPNTSMVYTIDTNRPNEFQELSFPETDSNPYAIKYFKGQVILFMNGGNVFVSNDKCISWSKLTNLKTNLNINISSGGNDILIDDDTMYICGQKTDTYPNYESYVIYTQDLDNWKSASCPGISRFNNMVKFKNRFVFGCSSDNKLVTTNDFTDFSIIDGVPGYYVQTTGTTLYAINEDNKRIIQSTKDLENWKPYKLKSSYSSVWPKFGYVGKYIIVNDNSDVKLINYLKDYVEYTPLTVNQGGTGAATAEKARTNLNVYSKSEVDQKIKDTLPEIPSNQGAYTLKAVNGVLEWTE